MRAYAFGLVLLALVSGGYAARANAQPVCAAPNMLIVFDSSGSMADTDRIGKSKNAAKWLVQTYDGRIRFGLMPFPKSTTACTVEPPPTGWRTQPVGATSANLVSTISQFTADGQGTPLAIALTKAKEYYQNTVIPTDTPGRSHNVLLLTDGKQENCSGSEIGSVQALYALGIKTYVVGIDITNATLNSMAVAGGTAVNGQAYRVASDYTALENVFDAIAQRISQEVCGNGVDDNCDGNIDEGCCTDTNDPCDTGLFGFCAAGLMKCATANGPLACLQTNQPQSEICDGLDNNCDGSVDEYFPEQTVPCQVPGAQGICLDGHNVCTNGQLSCAGNVQPTPETCDNIDSDCDGTVDEELVQECSTICGTGTEYCLAGQWTGCDARQPEPEICDEADNDCDGQIDEENAQAGSECDTGMPGECQTGHFGCVAGGDTCIPAIWPAEEICDGKDNDCNGETDEGNPQGGKLCVTGQKGLCSRGHEFCTNAALDCVADFAPQTEICNGVDDNCDGVVDDGVTESCGGCQAPPAEVCNGLDENCDGQIDNAAGLCPAGQECVRGECVRKCGAGGECASGLVCLDYSGEGYCLTLCNGVQCDAGKVCDVADGQCHDPCAGVTCNGGERCLNGQCTAQDCYQAGCNAGQKCSGGNCVPDPCAGKHCAAGEFCRDGACIKSCSTVSCAYNEKCADGQCVPNPCATVECPGGQVCNQLSGACEADPCAGVQCDHGVCLGGACKDDPCLSITCPGGGVCLDGQCLNEQNPTNDPTGGIGEGEGEGSDEGEGDEGEGDEGEGVEGEGVEGEGTTTEGEGQTTTCFADADCGPGCVCSLNVCACGPISGEECPAGQIRKRDGTCAAAAGQTDGGPAAAGSGGESGCGCRTTAGESMLPLCGLALLLIRRRRRG